MIEMQVMDTRLACWLCSLDSVFWQISFLYCFSREMLLDLAQYFQVIWVVGGWLDIIPKEREKGCQISLICSST